MTRPSITTTTPGAPPPALSEELLPLWSAALAHHQAKRLDQALKLYQDLLARQPDFLPAYTNLGAVYFSQNRPLEALAVYDRALAQNPELPQVLNNRGQALRRIGCLPEARASFERALALQPQLELARRNRDGLLREINRLDQALARYRGPAGGPEAAAALNNRGLELQQRGRLKLALAHFDQALRHTPDSPPVLSNRAHVLNLLRRSDEARAAYEQALASFDRLLQAQPRNAAALNQRGRIRFNLDCVEEALRDYDRALELDPRLADAYHNRGYALQTLGRHEQARGDFERALALRPELAMAQLNYGMNCLLRGDWRRGWRYYEARWEGSHESTKGALRRIFSPLPLWQGQPPGANDRLLVFTEQGMGDNIQFGRYLTLAAERFGRVSFTCPAPLARLFRLSFDTRVEILDKVPTDHSRWTHQCPLMSLSLAFDTTPETVPATVPYLRYEAGIAARWGRRIDERAEGRLKVGLVWAGHGGNKSDSLRSIPLKTFTPLLGLPGVAWVSLQKGEGAAELLKLHEAAGVIDLMDDANDFADTAALIAGLDLVISVDTSVAHLGGALGKPVWLLNRFETEWRWMLEREDSPWYPTMRIFRQRAPGDWVELLARVATALRERAG